MKSQKWVIGSLVFLIIILGGFILLNSYRQNDYQSILNTCANTNQNKYASCLGKELLDYANKNPDKTGKLLTYIYHNARHEKPIDLRLLSEFSHHAGMVLASKQLNLSEAAQACGSSFKGGCLHGFVMDRLDDETFDPDQITTMNDYCIPLKKSGQMNSFYMNCLHGVGHEFWAKGHTDLNHALAFCDNLVRKDYKYACWSGVIMEYSKTGTSTGHHSHAMTADKDVPCQGLDAKYQQICYTSQGSYRQYYPGKENIEVTYKYCASVPSGYTISCKAAATDRLKLAVGKSVD